MSTSFLTPADSPATSVAKTAGRVLLGAFVVTAGIGHFTFARTGFRAQVPNRLPLDEDFVVLASGVVEVVLGSAMILARRRRPLVGRVAAAFFVAVYPGNISQLVNHADGAGLDSDRKRIIRMPFQALMVADALWSTNALRRDR